MNEKLPKAYRLGYQDFYGRDFLVSPDVLIPRPETEAIVDVVLGLVGVPMLPGVKAPTPKIRKDCRILDVGTGSGCVAISLKLKLPKSRVVACDISEDALKVARENAGRLDAEIDFYKSDLLKDIDGNFDVIVANLPYVDKHWRWLDKDALGFEPSLALYADDGGLSLIKRLIDEVTDRSAYDSSEKYLVLEADPCQHKAIKNYALGHNLEYIQTNGFVLLFRISA